MRRNLVPGPERFVKTSAARLNKAPADIPAFTRRRWGSVSEEFVPWNAGGFSQLQSTHAGNVRRQRRSGCWRRDIVQVRASGIAKRTFGGAKGIGCGNACLLYTSDAA